MRTLISFLLLMFSSEVFSHHDQTMVSAFMHEMAHHSFGIAALALVVAVVVVAVRRGAKNDDPDK